MAIRNDEDKGMQKTFLVLTLLFAVILIAVPLATVKAQTSLTLYAKEISSSSYGFGLTSTSITSPGPTLNLVEGTSYTMTVNNVDTMPHSWEIVSSKATSTSPLWGAGIDISSYIPSGGSGSVTFTPTQTGNFYYVCTVPGHIALGMWGNVKVTSSSVPEFPSALTLTFLAVTVTAIAAFLAKQKIKATKFPIF
jgi:plastocyanin